MKTVAEPGGTPNQIAPVNRRYRSPLGVGGEFGRVIHDSAGISAVVTELVRWADYAHELITTILAGDC